MTPAQLAASKAAREGVPADAEQTAEVRGQAMRNVVAELMGRVQGLAQAMERSRVSPRPVDLTPGIVGVLSALSVAVSHLVDADLRARGEEPALVFRVPVEKSNGSGHDAGGPRLVVES